MALGIFSKQGGQTWFPSSLRRQKDDIWRAASLVQEPYSCRFSAMDCVR
jgi:hypothetical protein